MTLTLPARVKVWGSHVAAVNHVLCTDASGWVLHVTFRSFLPVLSPSKHVSFTPPPGTLTRVVKQLLGEDEAVVNGPQACDARLGLLGWVLLCPRLR